MGYPSTEVSESIRDDVGLDGVLKDLQARFLNVPWLERNVYLRAYDNVFPGPTGGNQTKPQVYVGNGEYLDVSINDNLPAALFFRPQNNEQVQFTKPQSARTIKHQRQISAIFWLNMDLVEIEGKGDTIYLEPIKELFMQIIAKSGHVISIDEYADGSVQEVFDGYTITNAKQYGKYPFLSMRINFTVQYNTGQTC